MLEENKKRTITIESHHQHFTSMNLPVSKKIGTTRLNKSWLLLWALLKRLSFWCLFKWWGRLFETIAVGTAMGGALAQSLNRAKTAGIYSQKPSKGVLNEESLRDSIKGVGVGQSWSLRQKRVQRGLTEVSSKKVFIISTSKLHNMFQNCGKTGFVR